jgi:hypothetical protein
MTLVLGSSAPCHEVAAESRDRCGWWATSDRIVMAVADGQGPEGAYAADVAIACVGAGLERHIQSTFAVCDARLRGTEGVALAVAVVGRRSGHLTVGSVGNIRIALLIADEEHHLNGNSGIVGLAHARVTLETRVLSSGDLFALFSDRAEQPFSLRTGFEGYAGFPDDPASKHMVRWARGGDECAALIYRHQSHESDGR